MSEELVALLVRLHNLLTERVHRSPTLRLILGPSVLACLREIERATENK